MMVLPEKHQECPVCTLYLRPGISLKQHLETHPKEQVIEALLSQLQEPAMTKNSLTPAPSTTTSITPGPPTPQLTTAVTYQQILTTNSAGTVVPQFLQVPALVNPSYALSQNMGFAPTLFNPLYNPYVPQQYHPFNNSGQASEAQLITDPKTPPRINEVERENSERGSVEMELSLDSPLSSSRPSSPELSPPSVIIARAARSKTHPVPRSSSKSASRRKRSPILSTATSKNANSSFSEPPEKAPLVCKAEDTVIVEVVSVPTDSRPRSSCKAERSTSCKLEITEVTPGVEIDLSERISSFSKNPCPNLPFDHEVVADLPSLSKLSYDTAEPSTSHVSDHSDQLLNQLNSEEVSNCEVGNFEEKSDDELCFEYVDEAANFSAPGSCNPPYSDLLPSSSPRLLHDLMPATSPKLLHDLLPTASSSNAYVQLDDGLRIFFNNNSPTATASRVPSPPSVIQMADSTKKEYIMPLNIAADESMPARGELSEQESLGADSAWGMFQSEMKIDPCWSVPENKPLRCPLCPMTFSCPKERRTHKVQAHSKPGKVFKCSTCGLVFTNLRDRRAHMTVHSDVKPVKEEMASSSAGQGAPEVTSTVRHCPATHCTVTLPSVKELRVHMRVIHNEVRFRCHECEECFDEETDYNIHLKKHPLKCPECNKCFYRRANLNMHLKRHLPKKPFECHLCPKSFITRQKLEEHSNSHTGVKPLKCGQCDKTFNRHSNLIQHRNSHHAQGKKKLQVRDFVCRCGEVFHSQRKLEWHREIHDIKPKSCPYCSQKFIHAASVTRHVRRSHKPGYLPNETRTEDENVSCRICDKVYLRGSLAVHMKVHNGIRNFQCNVCAKSFTTKWNMELHMWTHQSRTSMPFKCNLCKSAFFREADHIAHLNAHKNLKPYICNVCGQKFIRKYNCLRHQEEHQRAKRFVCTVAGCNRTFHRSYYLKDHMKVHTGARPHTCHMCGKASSTKSNHNKHVRIHDIRELVNTEN